MRSTRVPSIATFMPLLIAAFAGCAGAHGGGAADRATSSAASDAAADASATTSAAATTATTAEAEVTADPSSPTSPTTTSLPMTTSTVAPQPVPGDGTIAVLGSAVPWDEDLYLTSADPAWTLDREVATYQPRAAHQLVIVGDGDIADQSRTLVSVSFRGILDPATIVAMDAVNQPIRVGGVNTIGRTYTALQGGALISQLMWPGPHGEVASITAVGLDLQTAADLAGTIRFDGLNPVLDPTGGYRALEGGEPNVLGLSAEFHRDDVGMAVRCRNDGDAGLAGDLISRQVTTVPQVVDGVLFAQPLPLPGFEMRPLQAATPS